MMDGSNLKRGHTRLKGGSTSHPECESNNHTPSSICYYTTKEGGIWQKLVIHRLKLPNGVIWDSLKGDFSSC